VMDQEDGRHETAIPRFVAALQVRPAYVQARVRLAASLRRTRRAPEALAEYRRAMADDAALAEARIGYAMTLAQLGRYRQARTQLEEARTAAPESAVFAHGLARLLVTAPDASVRDGATAKAIVETLVRQGRTLDLGETMAMTLAELGEFERAAAVQRDLITAASRASLGPVVARLTANLGRYERRQPCRVPWTEQEWP
jgi:tetratricopeptide (TPR) repeat protein